MHDTTKTYRLRNNITKLGRGEKRHLEIGTDEEDANTISVTPIKY